MENLNVKIQGSSESHARFVAGARQFSIVIDDLRYLEEMIWQLIR